MPFQKKSFYSIYSETRCIFILKNDSTITKFIFYQWSEKIILDFNERWKIL